MPSASVLQDALNRLGGRQPASPASGDLLARTPPHLPLVVTAFDARRRSLEVRALNVEALMQEHDGDERAALDALAAVLAGATFDASGPGDHVELWGAGDRRTLARQLVQWALDHPEHGLHAEAFTAVRPLLDALGAGP